MAGEKFLALHTDGTTKEVIANQVGGAGAENKVAAYDSTGRLPVAGMPVGIVAETFTGYATETLTDGDFANIFWEPAGAASGMQVRKADATNSRRAHGFVLATYNLGEQAIVQLEGTNTHLTGLTAGSRYLLSATIPGGVSTAVPTTAGYIVQEIGLALSTTELTFEPGEPVTRA